MGRVIVVQFITLDGVVEDPDGSDGTSFGGWAMRFGPQGVAGDKFRLGGILDSGTLLFGRRTWEHFATVWPARDDEFSRAMNRARKAVVTNRPLPADAWSNSVALESAPDGRVDAALPPGDVVVIGSRSLVTVLAAAGAVDEYRLLTFPIAVGDGRRLFGGGERLRLVSTEQVGPAGLAVYDARP